jgi:hypothetical protein
MNVSRANVWGVAPDNARWLGWLILALAMAAVVLWWRSRPAVPALWSGALALSLLGSPYSWSYDEGILVVAAAVVIAAVGDRPGRIRTPVLLALASAWTVLPWLLYLEAHRTGAETAAAIVPLLMLALVIATDRIRRKL